MAQERNLSIRQSLAVTFCTEVIDGDQVLPVPTLTLSVVLTQEEIAALPRAVLERAHELLDLLSRRAYKEAVQVLNRQYEAGGETS